MELYRKLLKWPAAAKSMLTTTIILIAVIFFLAFNSISSDYRETNSKIRGAVEVEMDAKIVAAETLWSNLIDQGTGNTREMRVAVEDFVFPIISTPTGKKKLRTTLIQRYPHLTTGLGCRIAATPEGGMHTQRTRCTHPVMRALIENVYEENHRQLSTGEDGYVMAKPFEIKGYANYQWCYWLNTQETKKTN